MPVNTANKRRSVLSGIPVLSYAPVPGTPDSEQKRAQSRWIYAGMEAAIISSISAFPTFLPADNVSTGTVTVTISDGAGNPVIGATVTLHTTPGGAVGDGTTALTDVHGKANFTVKSPTKGLVTYTATTNIGVAPSGQAFIHFGGRPKRGSPMVYIYMVEEYNKRKAAELAAKNASLGKPNVGPHGVQ